jgi:hypothetical protein
MVPRPKLSPPTAGPASRPSPRPEPSLGTVEPSADGPDRTPRSLAEAGFRPHADGTYRYRSPGYPFKATLHPNGRVEFHLKVSQAHRVGLPEIVRAANGREIYVRAKKRLLQQTFELRLNLAVSWAREQMDSQLRSLYRQLMLTWKHPGWTPARRRLELFTLWDDCEESLTLDLQGIEDAMLSKIDAQRQSAGKKARRKIIEFIGRHLAKGSEHAYSDLELQELNAKRRSAERFAPYAG